MSAIKLCVALAALAAAATSCSRARGDADSARDRPGSNPGFALLELFTSEGCSSCPPADAVLADITRTAQRTRQPVYTLSFHVDYWNSIGWRDPFSSASASTRQHGYARALRENSVYTPQLVVNGAEAFVGSNAGRAGSAISAALKRAPALQLTLSAAAGEPGQVRAQYRLTGALPKSALLNVALVQPKASSKVTRGENAGLDLQHVNVVRAFSSVPVLAGASGTVTLPRPADLAQAGVGVTAYVQDAATLEILGATSTLVAGS